MEVKTSAWNGAKDMTVLLMVVAVCVLLGSYASGEVQTEDRNLRFRCEVILPKREWGIPVKLSNPTKIELGLQITNTGTDDLLVLLS